MNLKELREKLARLSAEGQTLIAKQTRGEKLSEAEDARIAELVPEIRSLKEEITTAEQREADLRLITETDQQYNQRAQGQQRASGQEPREGRERPASEHPFLASESFQRFRANNGTGNTDRVSIGSPYLDAPMRSVREIIHHTAEMSPEELRTIVSLGATTDLIQGTRLPGIYRQTGARENRVRDLFINGRTDTGIISFVRETSRTNNAGMYAEVTSNPSGATEKPESAIAFDVQETTAKLIAHSIPVTRQMLQDMPAMETYLEQFLLEGLADKEDEQLLSGDGTGNNLKGLLNQTGIQELDATYFGTTEPLPSDANELDRVRRAKTKVRLVGRSRASGIVANPADVEIWETMKDDQGNYLLTRGGPDGSGVATLWGLPITESEEVDEKTAIVGDFRQATVWDRMDAQVFMTDSHSNWFLLNLIALLAEERLAFTVFRPKAFAVVTLRA